MKTTKSSPTQRWYFSGNQLSILLLLLGFIGLFGLAGCPDDSKPPPTVNVTNGKIKVTGIPDGVKSVVISLETETGMVTFERTVENGTFTPIELGPEFAGKGYPPGKIKISTFDESSNEKKYQNTNNVEIKQSDEVQELPLSDFNEV